MKREQWIGSGMLLFTAVIWGCAVVAQKVAMNDRMGPFTFGAWRFILGALTLLPFIGAADRRNRRRGERKLTSPGTLLLGGAVCGLFLFTASSFQQVGLQYTTVGKSGFITSMYVVLVPLFGFLIFRHRLSPAMGVGLAIALVGLYLLCGVEEGGLNKGDALTLVSAALYAGHILAIDYFVARTDGVKLSCLQFFVSAAVYSAVALWREGLPSLEILNAARIPLLYTGIMSSGVGFTLQTLGQKRTPPALAALIMCMESVFAVLAGVALLHETLTVWEGIGCLMLFGAMVLVQVPSFLHTKLKGEESQ